MARQEGPVIKTLFSLATEAESAEQHRELLLEAAWRMGLCRSLRQRSDIPEHAQYLLWGHEEPRWWWGSWELWEAAMHEFEVTCLSDVLNAERFSLLCLAAEELEQAAIENPAKSPDDPPLTEEDRRELVHAALRSVEQEELDPPESSDPYERMARIPEWIGGILFRRWTTQRLALTSEERQLVDDWANLFASYQPVVDVQMRVHNEEEFEAFPLLWAHYLQRIFPEEPASVINGQ